MKRNIKQLFKPLLNTIKLPSKKRLITKDLDFAAGIEYQLQNPDALLEKKGKGLELFDTMMLDDTISGTIELKKRMTLSVDGDVMPATDSPADVERAQFITDMLYQMNTNIWNVFDNMLDAMIYGFKVGEKIWDVQDGKWIIKDIKIRHSKLFDFDYDEYGDLKKLYIGYKYGSDNHIEGYDNIMRQFLVFVWPYVKDGNWYGNSDLSELYLQYWQKFNIYRWRGVYLQNYGQPIPVVDYVKNELESNEKEDLKDLLDNLQDNLYLLIPGLRDKKSGDIKAKFKVNLMEAKTTSTEAYEKAITQINTDMQRKLLWPSDMGFTDTKGGSYARSQTQFNVLMTVIRDEHGKLEDMINPTIRQVEDYNFANIQDYSEWKFREINKQVEKEMLQMLIDKSVINPHEKWIRAYTGVPEITVQEQKEIEDVKEKELQDSIRKKELFEPAEDNDDKGENPFDKNDKKEKEKKEFKNKQEPINYKKIEENYNTFENEFVVEYNKIHFENDKKLVKQVERKYNLEKKDYKFINALRIDKTALKDLFSLYYAKLYFQGKVDVIDEVKDRLAKRKIDIEQGKYKNEFQIEDSSLDKKFWKDFLEEYGDFGALTREDAAYLQVLRQKAFVLVGVEEARIIKEISLLISNGLDRDTPLKEIISKMEMALREDRKKYATTIARTNASTAYNQGRMNEFRSDTLRPYMEAYQYTAIIDSNTTMFCQAHDGQILKADSSELGMIWPPNHFNCRSMFIGILVGDGQDKNSYFYDYEDKMPAWGTNKNIEGKTFDMNNPAISKPAKGF